MTVLVLMCALGVGSLLASLLVQRVSDRLARRQRDVAGAIGLDVTPVLSRIDLVRKNFVAELQSQERDYAYQRELLRTARDEVINLAFFRRRSDDAAYYGHER